MSVVDLNIEQNHFTGHFQKYSEKYFSNLYSKRPEIKILWDSLKYSFESGGKRFRPFLCYLVATTYKQNPDKILPYALAVEMIHTYSLIHDDLPCMDNDDYRRGQPTNHKVFGEDIALLAGDAFLTEAFALIVNEYQSEPDLALKLIQILSFKAGSLGMIGGQVLDMKSQANMSFEQVRLMHQLKTGALIEAAVLGSAHICDATQDEVEYLSLYGQSIGLAFQIKDDILDADDKDQDFKSFVTLLGLEKTNLELRTQSNTAQESLQKIKDKNVVLLKQLITYNYNRDK